MALVTCPECGRTNVSEFAERCPSCGYPIAEHYSGRTNERNIIIHSQEKKTQPNTFPKPTVTILLAGILAIVFGLYFFSTRCSLNGCFNKKANYSSNGYCSYHQRALNSLGNNYNSSTSSTRPNSSSIFSNLSITNFRATAGQHGGKMSCEVKNNNPYTVSGYFYVNFYNSSGQLLYNQLMELPDVASGETVSCSSLIPKSDFDVSYDSVKFTQANLIKVD